ncbi:MAG: GntR family transcriptional regulator [Pseudomonadota bacterium]
MPIPVKAEPINRSFMREEVYNTILSWIMEGELRPGEKLLDKELAENMGVSRTPVREALRRLEDKNLVESSANRWTRVTEVSIREPEMIYPIIWSLEELAAQQAMPGLTQADFDDMAAANRDLAQALDTKDPVAASRADARFHDVYIRRSGNYHLIGMLQDLKIKCRRVEVTYFQGTACGKYSLDEHYRIIDALGSGDLELARQVIRSNWQSSLKRLRNLECRIDDTDN